MRQGREQPAENWNYPIRSEKRGSACPGQNSQGLVFLDHDFLVMQIVRHGDDKKQNDQSAAHGDDFPPIASGSVRADRRAEKASAEQSDSDDCHANPNEI